MRKITGCTDVNIGWTHMLFYTHVNMGIHMHVYIKTFKKKEKRKKRNDLQTCYMSFVTDTYEHGGHIISCVRKQNYQKFTRCPLYNKQSSTFLLCLFLNSSICIIKTADHLVRLFSFLFILCYFGLFGSTDWLAGGLKGFAFSSKEWLAYYFSFIELLCSHTI